jgi:hypothetical protein
VYTFTNTEMRNSKKQVEKKEEKKAEAPATPVAVAK